MMKIIIDAHKIAYLENPKATAITRDKSSIVNMVDPFRFALRISDKFRHLMDFCAGLV